MPRRQDLHRIREEAAQRVMTARVPHQQTPNPKTPNHETQNPKPKTQNQKPKTKNQKQSEAFSLRALVNPSKAVFRGYRSPTR